MLNNLHSFSYTVLQLSLPVSSSFALALFIVIAAFLLYYIMQHRVDTNNNSAKEAEWFHQHWKEQVQSDNNQRRYIPLQDSRTPKFRRTTSSEDLDNNQKITASTGETQQNILFSKEFSIFQQTLYSPRDSGPVELSEDFLPKQIEAAEVSSVVTPAGAPDLLNPDSQAPMVMKTQVFLIPHPDKVSKGGEDAYFVSSDGKAIGIADGVGGWALHGIDPAIFANCLMQNAQRAYELFGLREPVQLLNFGFQNARSIPGSSTACILVVNDGKLGSSNLGDSGFLLIRNGVIIYRTKEQQHLFNFPVQLGTGHNTTPFDSDQAVLDVQEGDIVILATDGLFDNLFDEEILQICNLYSSSSKEEQQRVSLAELLATRARQQAGAQNETPFTRHAFHLGFLENPIGGKMDDITVLAGFIQSKPPHETPPSQ